MTQNHAMTGGHFRGPSSPMDGKIDTPSVLLDRINARARARKAAQANNFNVLPGKGDAEIDQFLKGMRNASKVEGEGTVSTCNEMHKIKKKKHKVKDQDNDMYGTDSEIQDSKKKNLKKKKLDNDVKNNEGEDKRPKKKSKKCKHSDIDGKIMSDVKSCEVVADENKNVCDAEVMTPKKKKKKDSPFKVKVQSLVDGNDDGEIVKKKKKKEYQDSTVVMNWDIDSLNYSMNDTQKSEGSQEEVYNESIGKKRKRKKVGDDDNEVTDETSNTYAVEGKANTSPEMNDPLLPESPTKKIGVAANTEKAVEQETDKGILSNSKDGVENLDKYKIKKKPNARAAKAKSFARKQRKKRERSNRSKHKEVGGFTLLGEVESATKEKLHRTLPHWLAHPTLVGQDLKDGEEEGLSAVPGLADWLKVNLKLSKVPHFFPIQRALIPELLATGGPLTARYRPRDVCVSAPTGSGKTLAYVLPLLQLLNGRTVTRVRALILLPIQELAIQVYKTFLMYKRGSNLKIGLMVGMKPFGKEQAALVEEDYRGWHSLVDIIVATPGRLNHHLALTPGFDISALRYLVLDEADNLLTEKGGEWIARIDQAVRDHVHSTLPPPHRLLFSATLSLNPEMLQQVYLHHPRLFTVSTSTSYISTGADMAKERTVIGQYVRPAELVEEYVVVDENIKPLVLYNLICGGISKEEGASKGEEDGKDKEVGQNTKTDQGKEKAWHRVLIFTNSIKSTHRLAVLLSLLAPDRQIAEFSTGMKENRKQIVSQFKDGKIDILVSSDVMARGLDIPNIEHVVSYEVTSVNTYIHRIGRTARAGRPGTALSLITQDTLSEFKRGLRSGGAKAQRLTVNTEELEPYEEQYVAALASMKEVLWKEEQQRRKQLRASAIGRKPNREGKGDRDSGNHERIKEKGLFKSLKRLKQFKRPRKF